MPPRVFAPAILSGLLLWTAFYPLNLGFMAYFAMVPWLTLVRAPGVSARRRYFAAYVGGLAFFLPALQWIRVAHPAMYASWFGLSIFYSGIFPLALAMLRRLDRLGMPPLALTLPIVWVGLEYVRAHFPTGFPFLKSIGSHQYVGFGWYFLGHTQHDYLTLIQIADLGGVYLISFLVAASNGALAEWLMRNKNVRRLLQWPAEYRIGFFREMWTTAGVTMLIMISYAYGITQMQHPDFLLGPRVSAIQADIPQDVKMGQGKSVLREYNELCEQVALRADLVVWPETCFPPGWTVVTRGVPKTNLPKDIVDGLKDNAAVEKFAATRWKTNVLLGTSLVEWDGEKSWQYNSAILAKSDGTIDGRYDKMHLVPFGEYVPFRQTFPWLRHFTPYDHDYSCKPGETATRFDMMVGEKPYTFGCLICYEDSDPYLARQFNLPKGDQKPVDFLVNISNDGWFRGTEQHEQHLAICKFRAIEARRTVVRAVNMGISAIIDSEGRLQAIPGDTVRESKRIRGTVTDKIRLDTRESFYAKNGDWLPALCWTSITLGLIVAWRRATGLRATGLIPVGVSQPGGS